jgi:hypothetical protein
MDDPRINGNPAFFVQNVFFQPLIDVSRYLGFLPATRWQEKMG